MAIGGTFAAQFTFKIQRSSNQMEQFNENKLQYHDKC